MQILRTLVWALLLVALVAFSVANWTDVTVHIWPGILMDTKIPAIVIIAFAIGFVPMWLYLRATKWQAKRRIQSLESAARVMQATPPPVEPTATEAEAVDATPHAATEAETPATPPAVGEPLSPVTPLPPTSSKPEQP